MPKNARKILVIKNDKIGDMILSTCVFRELKKNYPYASITVVASNSNKSIIEKNKNIDKIIIRDYPPKKLTDFIGYFKLGRELKKEKFDIGIDLRGSIINIFFLLGIARIKYRIGFYNRYFSKFFLDYAYKKDRKNKHVCFQRIDLLNKALGINAKDYWPEIAYDKKDEEAVERFLKRRKLKDFFCIVPDASSEEKQWPLEKWDELIKELGRRYQRCKIVLAGVDDGKNKYLLRKNKNLILPERDLLYNLRAMYLLFKKSSLVIAHDGGMMHLAWAGKSKIVALMADYLQINYLKPLGKNSRFIEGKLEKLRVDEVMNVISGLI